MLRHLVLTFLICCTLGASAAETAGSKPSGLSAGPNGTVLKDGKTYRAIGVNYFDCFVRTLSEGHDTSYDAGFATLAAKGIPFVRFCATGFWPKDMQLYQTNRVDYFHRLDGVVKSAEKHGIGLVPSLFWYYSCIPDLVGESMDQWANPKSKTQAWMREYVREVITRYCNSSSIWAWEFGNEYSLQADLPNAREHRPPIHSTLGTASTRGERDDVTSSMVRAAFTAFADEVRKYDRHRLILTGDSFPRPSAWHQERDGTWTKDTLEQFAESLTKANPDPINGISLHLYENEDARLATAVEVSRKLNKPIFIGEFGSQGESAEQAANCRRLLKSILDLEIPLAALWVFDYASQKEFNVTSNNLRSNQLEIIAGANQNLRNRPLIKSKSN